MSLQRIPHDATKYRSNPVELLNISNRNRIGSDYAVTANTKLLITGTGENNSTTILDSTGKTVTRYGDTKISTAQSIIGGSSIYFDGTGDYLSLADSDDWYFGNGNFTIDFWIRWTSVPGTGYQYLFAQYPSANERMAISVDNNRLFFSVFKTSVADTSFYCAWTPINNTWYHVAVIRKGFGNSSASDWLLAVDGVSKSLSLSSGTWNSSIINISSSLSVGGLSEIPSFIGYLSHVRVTKGQALWTSNFTSPSTISDYYASTRYNYIGA